MMKYFHSWSGGKDSTAAIILDHIHGLPPSRIVFCEVMYDRKNGISGELPEHIDFVKNVAIPKFTEWGFTVDLITAETDYLENFFHIISKSRNGNNGKMRGFPLSGRCTINRDCKFMEEAETKFTDGATRKEWVMAMVQTSAEYINYPVDVTALGELIDALCDMTKVVNFEEIPVIEPVKGGTDNDEK